MTINIVCAVSQIKTSACARACTQWRRRQILDQPLQRKVSKQVYQRLSAVSPGERYELSGGTGQAGAILCVCPAPKFVGDWPEVCRAKAESVKCTFYKDADRPPYRILPIQPNDRSICKLFERRPGRRYLCEDLPSQSYVYD